MSTRLPRNRTKAQKEIWDRYVREERLGHKRGSYAAIYQLWESIKNKDSNCRQYTSDSHLIYYELWPQSNLFVHKDSIHKFAGYNSKFETHHLWTDSSSASLGHRAAFNYRIDRERWHREWEGI